MAIDRAVQDSGHIERIPVDIQRGQTDGDRRVHVGGNVERIDARETRIGDHRRIVRWGYRDDYQHRVARIETITHEHIDGIDAVVIRRGYVGDTRVTIRQAVDRSVQNDRQHIGRINREAFRVYRIETDLDRCVFWCGHRQGVDRRPAAVHDHGWIVLLQHLDDHYERIRSTVPVADHRDQRVGSDEARIRRVCQTRITVLNIGGSSGERAIRHADDLQGIAVHVHRFDADIQRQVFQCVHGERIRIGTDRIADHRRIVHGRYTDHHRDRIATAVVVADHDVQRVRAVEVRIGRVGEARVAVGQTGHASAQWATRGSGHLQGIAVNVDRIQTDGDRRVFICYSCDRVRWIADRIHHLWRIVHRGHVDHHRYRIAEAVVVADHHRHGVSAVVVRVGCVGDARIAIGLAGDHTEVRA